MKKLLKLFSSKSDNSAVDSSTYAENLIEIAKIITNNNENAVRDISLLAKDYAQFYDQNSAWCEEMDFEQNTLLIFAYWLVGYNTDLSFGIYIDWCEDPEEVILKLKEVAIKLGYKLDLDKVDIDVDDQTDIALKNIDEYFLTKGYTLACLDTDSDSYHLFIIEANNYTRLVKLGNNVAFRFYNNSY